MYMYTHAQEIKSHCHTHTHTHLVENMVSSNLSINPKPHVVFIPFPFQGHITPQFKLAQFFHQKGFYVTFINTIANQKQFSSSEKNPISNLPDFDFETFDDCLKEDERVAPIIRWALCQSSRTNFARPLNELITKINENEKSPPVTCIIGDVLMPYTIEIAEKIGVPCIVCWVGSSAAFLVFKQYNLLKEKGFVPVKDETLDEGIDFLPGLSNLLVRDLPFSRKYDTDFPMKEFEHVSKASGIIINTFESLEADVLSAISTIIPKIYHIGPLQLIQSSTSNGESKSITCNLWEEQHDCLEWLDSMKPSSVLYIGFGSIATVSVEKLIELAWGILDSNYPFLWTMTHNTGDNDAFALPPDLMSKIKEKGYVTSWCPQELVLNHPSIGGFITHSGWNSTIESICAGVPMICWPQFGDHPVISRYSCSNWGIGMEMIAEVKRDEVVKLVKELMEGVQGAELKKRSMEWKKIAKEAASEGGSSWLRVEELLKDASYLSTK